MQKTIFIIPGFRHDPTHTQYDWLTPFFQSKGFTVKKFGFKWNHKTMTDFINDFSQFFRQNKSDDNTVLGFSFGAMAGLITATNLKPQRLVLCSLSPYFDEDLKTLRNSWKKNIGVNRFEDFKKYKAEEIAIKIKIPTIIIYGSKEGNMYPQLKIRCVETSKQIPNAKLEVADNAPHEIDFPSYVATIKKLFQSPWIS